MERYFRTTNMGSNINNDPFYFDYSIEFDDNFVDADDGQSLDDFLASLTPDICPDPIELRALIVNTSQKLSDFMTLQNGVHHIARIITYNNYKYKILLDNTDWIIPGEQISEILTTYIIGNKYEFIL